MCCNCICVCSCEAVPDSEVKSLVTSKSFPGKPVAISEDVDYSKQLSEGITPSVVQLFLDSFGYAYEGSNTKPVDSPGKNIANVSAIEVLENYSALPVGNTKHVRVCIDNQFTKTGNVNSLAILKIADDVVTASETFFAETPLHVWKTQVFNTSNSHPTITNGTQETRGAIRYTHIERDSATEEGVKEKLCILYYVAVTWESVA